MTEAIVQLLWVAAYHGLRQRAVSFDPQDAAPCPRRAWRDRLWGFIFDLTIALGNPPAPGGPR